MNIAEAKDQVKNTVTAYLTKDDLGNYEIPTEKQRPVFLMGPPGVGKTAIMAQVANEMNIGLVPYSMTHHTRQSALGLPKIVTKKFGDEEYDITEYTMSEIISSIYDVMEKTGVKNGILFLDEINCVSETLSPVMLQFLQYKEFGKHKVPEGWVVVTAGNPPEYNNSVHEFDIVTWDRLKRVDVEPDYPAWKEYASAKGVHPAILTYLENHHDNFYTIESTAQGKSFSTARGWDDLSDIIYMYEKHGLDVDRKLIGQYIQNDRIARDFAIYYDLFNKYKSDYQVDKILAGKAPQEILEQAQKAKFDERYALLGLMMDALRGQFNEMAEDEKLYEDTFALIKAVKLACARKGFNAAQFFQTRIKELEKEIQDGRTAGTLSSSQIRQKQLLIRKLDSLTTALNGKSSKEVLAGLLADYKAQNAALKKKAAAIEKDLSNVFSFIEKAWSDGNEMLIFVTELTADKKASAFISKFGCDDYFKHNQSLMLSDRENQIQRDLDALDLDKELAQLDD